MANESHFDLEQEIKSWRETLVQQGSLEHSTIDELESHVRDAHAELLQGDLNAEEAFLIACRRLGHQIGRAHV